ncbi:protocatechuate 3 4-dioxygenase beta subunit [Fusarium pseudoanthophilum]|uniref:Protocatechuate 3 4-dioxygenase beta subunit n=1 Tax=Fusarium pseudoanthophilum TaxID=48495 RepID=A0A8H5P427_9HYPO|nr:protocatechuate 3 4-dioxygenase beta subunit [Fusarium pseudoanthophilum]
MRLINSACFFAGLLAGIAGAHPSHDHSAEAAVRREFLQHSRRDLSHCTEHLRARGHIDRQIARRRELARSLRLAEGLDKRALSDINKSHHSDEHYTFRTPPEILFGSNNSCILSPEVMEGPYYVAGEFVRKDITDSQEGVPLYIDTQVIDVNTCEPVPDIFVEIWHCNSTGVYSGIIAEGNGNANDEANINLTYLRGLQPTDSDGISLFKSIFPGHYTFRTTHIHVMAHINATMLANGTVMNTVASHVGQMFFDQDLINEVEELKPYTDNTQELWLNNDDDILAEEAATSDPMMHWVYLGDNVSDGILAWLSFGVNTTYVREVSAAAFYYKDGGVTNPTASFSP